MNEMYVTRDEEEGIRSSNELPRDPVFLSPSTVKMHQNSGIFTYLAIPAVRPSSHARARFRRHNILIWLTSTSWGYGPWRLCLIRPLDLFFNLI